MRQLQRKPGPQRSDILVALLKGRSLTAKELLSKLRNQDPAFTMAKLYMMLTALREKGMVCVTPFSANDTKAVFEARAGGVAIPDVWWQLTGAGKAQAERNAMSATVLPWLIKRMTDQVSRLVARRRFPR
jgi:Ferric uptake regulator family